LSSPNILVIGGGISGLACAYRLQKQGFAVRLLEANQRFGGVLNTVEQDGFRFDVGPQSFLANPAISELIEELGLSDELLKADPRAPRYILLRGKLIPAPLGPGSFLSTPLISWRTKLRILSEPIFRSYPPDEEESIAAFIRRKFGEDVLTNLAGPFISGVYAGDPEKLSLTATFPIARALEEKFGGIIRGAIQMRRAAKAGSSGPRPPRPALCNFRRGTVTLVGALAKSLGEAARTATQVTALQQSNAPGEPPQFAAAIRCSSGLPSAPRAGTRGLSAPLSTQIQAAAEQLLAADAIVVATPAQQAGGLLRAIAPQFPDLLSQIEYAPVAQIAAGYRLAQISRFAGNPARGFGFLVPRTEGLRLLGTVWESFLFANRAPEAPEKMASFTSFVGGATDPEIVARPADEIGQLVHNELAKVLGITGEPVTQYIARWERALPQYNLGHGQIVAGLNNLCTHHPGIFLTGNYLAGPSMGACIDHANKTAAAITQFLRPKQ